MDATRRVDIDGLRVVATYLLFVFHVGKVFDPAPFFHVWNDERSVVFLVLCGFISLWHMPLFFLLAGWSAASSLRLRGARGFLGERLRRLFVPLVAGCVLLAPVIKYLELRGGLDLNHRGLWVGAAYQDGLRQLLPGGLPLAPPFDERFADFVPTFFTQLDRFSWAHLWFVAYLFTMSIVYLPALVWLTRARPIAAASAWIAYAPLVPLVAVQLLLREGSRGIYNLYDDWANVAYYSVFLVAGALLACHPAVERVVDDAWKRSLAVATTAALVLLLGVVGLIASPRVLLVATAVAGWCFVVAALGLGRRVFRRPSPTLAYLSESAFPVYVLHQLAIVLPGSVVVGLALGVATKFVLLLLLAVAITMATYHWLVRPFAVPRFLLGMKPPPRRVRPGLVARRSAAAILVVGLAATPLDAATPEGVWYAEGGAARVAIARCGRALCGRVVWLRAPFDEDGCDLRDRNNPDPALRARPLVGIEILRDVPLEADDGTWAGGRIYDPTSGRTYSCDLTLRDDDRLHLRGYLGIRLLGRSTTWTRLGTENRQCRQAIP